MPAWDARLVLQLVASASDTDSTGALAADGDLRRSLGSYELGVGGGVELRGPDLGGAFTVRGGLYRPDEMPDNTITFVPVRFEHTIEVSSLPRITDRRDRLRQPFDRTSTTGWFDFVHDNFDGLTASMAPLELTVARDVQVDGDARLERDELMVGFAAVRYCRTPAGEPPRWCLSIIDFEVHMADGALPVKSGNLALVTVDHVAAGAWSVDASLGYGGGTIDIPGLPPPPPDEMDDPDTTCEDEGRCVKKHALTYDLAARSERVDLRAHRSSYPTMTGELAMEDRAEATLRAPLGGTTLAAHGFAAFTRWWTLDGDELARVGDAITGGGDLSAAREVEGWQLALSIAVARSFYASRDGGAPRAELGAQGTISMSRALERTW